jgi:hypothetical protein
MPIAGGIIGYIGGGIAAAAIGGPGTYITLEIFRLGLDYHPIGGKYLPHIDCIYKGKEVLHHWPWK